MGDTTTQQSESAPSTADFGVPNDATLEPSTLKSLARLSFPPNGEIVIGKASSIQPPTKHPIYLIVGRQAATCDIRISQKSLSRQHAILFYDKEGSLFVIDLAPSTATASKTLINGNAFPPRIPKRLHNGDMIQWSKTVQPVFTVIWKDEISTSSQQEATSNSQPQIPRSEQETETDNKTSTNDNEEPGKGLTGRAKRQAEIAAMMASLDETPTYTKPTIIPESEPSLNVEKSSSKSAKSAAILQKHKLPLTDSTNQAELDSTMVISSLAMDPSGARFAIACMDSSLQLFDFGGFNAEHPTPFTNVYVQEGYPIRSVAYSPSGDRCLVATGSTQPRVMSRDGEEILEFVRGDVYVTDPQKTSGHTAAVTSVVWHPLEQSIVFTTSRDGSLRVWNVDKGKLAFGMLKCDDTILVKNIRTGRKTVPTCLDITPKHVVMGTECGSLQIYPHPFVSKLRPQQSTTVLDGNEPVACVKYSLDATKLACRTSTAVVVYDAKTRLSTSSVPLLTCAGVGTADSDNATPTMAFSPTGKVLCIGVYDDSRSSPSRLDVYTIPKEIQDPPKSRPPIFSCPLESTYPVVGLSWHYKLNQMLVATTKTFQVWYSVEHSQKGVLLTAGRRRKRKMEDDLQDIFQARAPPPGAAVRSEEIITPNALPLFADANSIHNKRRHKQDKEEEEAKRKHPQQPAKSVYNTPNTIFAQMVVDNQTVEQKVIAGKDPRAALAKYSEGKSYIGTAYEGNKERILADKTVEEEEDEMKKK